MSLNLFILVYNYMVYVSRDMELPGTDTRTVAKKLASLAGFEKYRIYRREPFFSGSINEIIVTKYTDSSLISQQADIVVIEFRNSIYQIEFGRRVKRYLIEEIVEELERIYAEAER